jgi:hypothetical protein
MLLSLLPLPKQGKKGVLTRLSLRGVLVGSDVHLDATFNERDTEHVLGDLKQKGTLGNSKAVSGLAEG